MNRTMNFSEFNESETRSFPPPKYVVEPAKNDKGFFMFQRAFKRRKKKFDTGYFSSYENYHGKSSDR